MKRSVFYLLAFAGALGVANPSLRATESDSKIEQSFYQTYIYRSYLKDAEVLAKAQDGLVTLTGTVPHEYQKALAQKVMANLPGVARVENQLKVKENISLMDSDAWIREKVEGMLAFHRCVKNQVIEVKVVKGRVTLRGQAASIAQRELITQYAKVVKGVSDVQNGMTLGVSGGNIIRSLKETVDDASLCALIHLTLQYQGSTCALSNRVRVREGVVWLSGEGQDLAEQDLVATLLTDLYGVISVIDTHDGISLYGYCEESEVAGAAPLEGLAGNN